MSEYTYGGAADIDRAIGLFVALDENQKNALAVLQFDQIIEELQAQYELAVANPAYVPNDEFLGRLSGYLEVANDRSNPDLG
jgi:hypothetical protein